MKKLAAILMTLILLMSACVSLAEAPQGTPPAKPDGTTQGDNAPGGTPPDGQKPDGDPPAMPSGGMGGAGMAQGVTDYS